MALNDRILIISDFHAPYNHPDAVAFLKAVKEKYNPTRVISIGDESDGHSLSFHSHDADLHSAGHELELTREALKPLMKMFPKMDILESNHGSLVMRRALDHGLPREIFKSYREILEAPKGWNWHFDMTIRLPTGMDCYFHHGKNKNALKVAQSMGMCYVGGHYHEDFGIQFYANPNQLNFAMQVGCLIDKDSMAMAYAKNNLKRPIIGVGMIIDGLPLLLPLVMKKGGKWCGKIFP